MSTLRLIYPEWQGGGKIALDELLADLPTPDRYLGYSMGAKIIQMIAPKGKGPEIVVPCTFETEPNMHKVEDGVQSKSILLKEIKTAVAIIQEQQPERIVNIGGECSASVPAFTYLAEKYGNDLACIWMDAHGDLTLPYDANDDLGYHSMALAHVLGLGDKDILSLFPAKHNPKRTHYIGLRSIPDYQEKRRRELGIENVTPEENRENPQKIIEWLKSTGCKHVMIHLDLDVLDPQDLWIAVGKDPNGMKLAEVFQAIKLIGESSDIVGFSICEHVPSAEIRLAHFLNQLPIFRE